MQIKNWHFVPGESGRHQTQDLLVLKSFNENLHSAANFVLNFVSRHIEVQRVIRQRNVPLGRDLLPPGESGLSLVFLSFLPFVPVKGVP